MLKVWLDPGHGGSDPGAVSGNLIEKHMNLTTAIACKVELERHGVIVGMSRTTDIYLDLDERCALSNAWGPDFFVSIHYNAGGGDGVEAIHSIFHGMTDDILASRIVNRIVSELGQNTRPKPTYTRLNSRGTDYYGVIRGNNAPPVIVEGAFVDSADSKIVDTVEEQQRFGIAIAHGILDAAGMPTQNGAPVIPVQKPKANPGITCLRRGDKSTTVMEMQLKLVKLGYQLSADGDFGPRTEAAVKAFQLKYLGAGEDDGVAGPKTLGKLNEAIAELNKPVPGGSSKVRAYQELTRALGITDKNGNLLDVDGSVGALTKSTYAKMPVLRIGSRGEAVRWVQTAVGADPDGCFGPLTAGKIKEYQWNHHIADDSVVGPNTYRVLVEG